MTFPWKRLTATASLTFLLTAAGPVPNREEIDQAATEAPAWALTRASLEQALSHCRSATLATPQAAYKCQHILIARSEATSSQHNACLRARIARQSPVEGQITVCP